jgi:hypothetical protein
LAVFQIYSKINIGMSSSSLYIKQEEMEGLPLHFFLQSKLEANSGDDPLGGVSEGRKPQRERISYTAQQLDVLEEVFQKTHLPDKATRQRVALRISLPENKISWWFKNRRAKERNEAKKDKSSFEQFHPIQRQSVPIKPARRDIEHIVQNVDIEKPVHEETDEDCENNYIDVSNFLKTEMDEIVSTSKSIPISNSAPLDYWVHQKNPLGGCLVDLRKKPTRHRVFFTNQHLEILEDLFNKTQLPDKAARQEVALKINMPESKVCLWFKNRRAKAKKEKSPKPCGPPHSYIKYLKPTSETLKSDIGVEENSSDEFPDENSENNYIDVSNYLKTEIDVDDLKTEMDVDQLETDIDIENNLKPEAIDNDPHSNSIIGPNAIQSSSRNLEQPCSPNLEESENSFISRSPLKYKVPNDLQSLIISSNPDQNIKFTYSQRMNIQMVVSGYLLFKKGGPFVLSSGKRKMNWKCKVPGCPYYVQTVEGLLREEEWRAHM